MQKVAILGFGVEGQDAARYFFAQKAEITVFDKKEKSEIAKDGWENKPIKWVCGLNYLDNGLLGFDLIVRSPGFYRFHPTLLGAEKQGNKVTSITSIFFEECKTPIIAVTGTKGKGTTSTMINLALQASGFKTVLGGNMGEPMLSLLPEVQKADLVVLELSSFQTIDLTRSPKIAVVTNITVDHLDWHKDRDEYVRAKENLWKHQTKGNFLVLNQNDKTCQELAKNAPGTVVWYDPKDPLPGNLQVPGAHNIANGNAALTAVKLAGANMNKAWQGIVSFSGTEHRLEKVAEINGVTYVNDSAATHPESTSAALHSFKAPKIIILGGSRKGVSFDSLAHEITRNNVKAVILIGQTADEIKTSLKKAGFKGVIKGGLEDMVSIIKAASALATKGDIVLLSPACASFGLFANYKDRGEQFKKAVNSLQ